MMIFEIFQPDFMISKAIYSYPEIVRHRQQSSEISSFHYARNYARERYKKNKFLHVQELTSLEPIGLEPTT